VLKVTLQNTNTSSNALETRGLLFFSFWHAYLLINTDL